MFNTELSIQNFRAAMAVPATLGLNPTIANSGKNNIICCFISLFPLISHFAIVLFNALGMVDPCDNILV